MIFCQHWKIINNESDKITESKNTIKPSHLQELEMYDTKKAVESTRGRALSRQ